MPDIAVELKPRGEDRSVHSSSSPSSSKSIPKGGFIAGTVGIMAGVAGAVGLAAYLRAPEVDESTVADTINPVAPTPESEAPQEPVAEIVEPVASAAASAPSHTAATPAPSAPAVETAATAPDATATAPTAATTVVNPNIASQHDAIEPLTDLNDVSIATGVTEVMGFNQAFASARAEVGAHGIFAWHGSLYHTYYRDEWEALPAQYRHEFSSHNYSEKFVSETATVDFNPEIHTDADGNQYVMLRDAFTGEMVSIPVTDDTSIVLDPYGNFLATVSNDQLIDGTGAILIDADGNVVNMATGNPDEIDAFLADYVAGSGAVIDVDEGDVLTDDDTFEINWDQADDVYVISDDDVSLIQLDDDASVVDIPDGYIDIVPDTDDNPDYQPEEPAIEIGDDDTTIEPLGDLPFGDYII